MAEKPENAVLDLMAKRDGICRLPVRRSIGHPRNPQAHSSPPTGTHHRMIDTLWIHIGMGKTGTSALQGYFDSQAGRLATDCGLRYLDTGRINRAHQLLSPTYRRAKNDEWQRCLPELEREIRADSCQAGLISSEFLCWDDEEYCRLLKSHIPSAEVRIVLFIREIGDLLYASFLQRVKSRPSELAGQEYQFGPYLRKVGMRFDFTERLAPWVKVFGRESIRIVDYDRMADRDSAAEMCRLLGVPHWAGDQAQRTSENGSLNAEDLDLLRFLDNAWSPPPAKRKELVAFLASRGGRTRTALPENYRARVEKTYSEADRAFRDAYGLQPRLMG